MVYLYFAQKAFCSSKLFRSSVVVLCQVRTRYITVLWGTLVNWYSLTDTRTQVLPYTIRPPLFGRLKYLAHSSHWHQLRYRDMTTTSTVSSLLACYYRTWYFVKKCCLSNLIDEVLNKLVPFFDRYSYPNTSVYHQAPAFRSLQISPHWHQVWYMTTSTITNIIVQNLVFCGKKKSCLSNLKNTSSRVWMGMPFLFFLMSEKIDAE